MKKLLLCLALLFAVPAHADLLMVHSMTYNVSGGTLVDSLPAIGYRVWSVSDDTASAAALQGIVESYPDTPMYLYDTIPNDSLFRCPSPGDLICGAAGWSHSSWFDDKNVTYSGGTPSDQDADGPEGWDVAIGDTNTIVAIIDTGLDFNHPEFNGQIWSNLGEIENNNIDDDGNGYKDDRHGWSTYVFAPGPLSRFSDDVGHGTHVAGIIGARTNNTSGVAGTMWKCKLMIIKALGVFGGTDASCIMALEYARRNGAKIVNNSWGSGPGSVLSTPMAAQIAACRQSGMLLVFAAGNSTNNNDVTPDYPSSSTDSCIISVGAWKKRVNGTVGDTLADFSSYGANSVDLFAPGQSIHSTIFQYKESEGHGCIVALPGGGQDTVDCPGYATLSGTSMATPFVTGTAGLIKSMFPNMRWSDIKGCILSGVDGGAANQYVGKCVSGGRLSIRGALNQAQTMGGGGCTPPCEIEGTTPGGGEEQGAKVGPLATPAQEPKLYDVQGRRVDPAIKRSGVTFGAKKKVTVK